MGSDSVTCHSAEVTFPPLPQPVKAGTWFIAPSFDFLQFILFSSLWICTQSDSDLVWLSLQTFYTLFQLMLWFSGHYMNIFLFIPGRQIISTYRPNFLPAVAPNLRDATDSRLGPIAQPAIGTWPQFDDRPSSGMLAFRNGFQYRSFDFSRLIGMLYIA